MNNNKIDKRRHYGLLVDTETAGPTSKPLFYDIGWIVIDTRGNAYERRNFINRDVFYDMYELMDTCYYKDKLPEYINRIRMQEVEVLTTAEIREIFLEDYFKYNADFMLAHNIPFDYRALNNTMRTVTDGMQGFFTPYNAQYWDLLKMVKIIVEKPKYRMFCKNNNFVTPSGMPSKTAETLFRFLSGQHDFIEEHTALADCEIELEIFKKCQNMHCKKPDKFYVPKWQKELDRKNKE